MFQPEAERLGLTLDEFFAAPADRTLRGRWPTLADVAEAAAFVASDRVAATTGTVVNLTAGSIVNQWAGSPITCRALRASPLA